MEIASVGLFGAAHLITLVEILGIWMSTVRIFTNVRIARDEATVRSVSNMKFRVHMLRIEG